MPPRLRLLDLTNCSAPCDPIERLRFQDSARSALAALRDVQLKGESVDFFFSIEPHIGRITELSKWDRFLEPQDIQIRLFLPAEPAKRRGGGSPMRIPAMA